MWLIDAAKTLLSSVSVRQSPDMCVLVGRVAYCTAVPWTCMCSML